MSNRGAQLRCQCALCVLSPASCLPAVCSLLTSHSSVFTVTENWSDTFPFFFFFLLSKIKHDFSTQIGLNQQDKFTKISVGVSTKIFQFFFFGLFIEIFRYGLFEKFPATVTLSLSPVTYTARTQYTQYVRQLVVRLLLYVRACKVENSPESSHISVLYSYSRKEQFRLE